LSTNSSAQYDTSYDAPFPQGAPVSAEPALRLQVAERLAAHRSRRTQDRVRPEQQQTPQPTERAARIAAAVAERYAKSPTYRAFLAEEAGRAIRQATEEAEAAARHAEAILAAERQLFADLEAERRAQITAEPAPQPAAPPAAKPRHARSHRSAESTATPSAPAGERAGLTVRLYQPAQTAPLANATAPTLTNRAADSAHNDVDFAEASALDEEIAFRQHPVFEEAPEPSMPLPANLIEFPRQLIAARKSRPRHAEGPLREEAVAAPGQAQLRIFEIEPAQISHQAPAEAATPEWSAIWLDAVELDAAGAPQTYAAPSHEHAPSLGDIPAPGPHTTQPRLHTAPIQRRLTAAALDASLVLAATVAFAVVLPIASGLPAGQRFAAQIVNQIGLPAAALSATAAIAFFFVLYHMLFCSLTDGTPGMRWARIALCTFSDQNPTRSAMRRRIMAAILSACALGLGFLWAALDEDSLSWHDRITRIYPRSY
jgi:uncharacterized RDD family membrane protein YckC